MTEILVRMATEQDLPLVKTVLAESFTGMYLWHAMRTLSRTKDVLCAFGPTGIAGASILKKLGEFGYVYYIAVKRAYRNRGIGALLLDRAIDFFQWSRGVFASVEEDNIPSLRLFESRGFQRVGFSWLQSKVGLARAVKLYQEMTVVPGEVVLYLECGRQRV